MVGGGTGCQHSIIGASLGNRKRTSNLPSSIISSSSLHLPRPIHPINHFLPSAQYSPPSTVTTVEGRAYQGLVQGACARSGRPRLASCEFLVRGCDLSGLSFLVCKTRIKIINNNDNNNKLPFRTKLFTHSTNTYGFNC